MKTKISAFVLLSGVCVSFNASSYPTPTHAAVTNYAVNNSVISAVPKKSAVMKKLGLVEIIAKQPNAPFSKDGQHRYFAIGPGPVWKQATDDFTREKIELARQGLGDYEIEPGKVMEVIPGDHTIAGWVMRGVIREDDNSTENAHSDDEGGGVFERVFAHFFDPVLNRGLTLGGVGIGPRSVDWATIPGTTSRAGLSGGERTNDYNLPAAKEAMWRALTGTTKSGSDAYPSGANDASGKNAARLAYWGSTFRTLGDVVHLLQDTAQPQHTRNDAHSGLGCVGVTCLGGHDSWYEKYMQARTTGMSFFHIEEGLSAAKVVETVDIKPRQLSYCCYPVVEFNTLEEYFSSAVGGDNETGRGLANFSNRNFLTAGTLESINYAYPSRHNYRYVNETITKDIANQDVNFKTTFVYAPISDTYSPSSSVPEAKIAALKSYRKPGAPVNEFPKLQLNFLVYDQMADLLIPRAVGYTAGLINYFFRGEMEITLPDAGVYGIADHSTVDAQFRKIKAKVANTTAPIGSNKQEMTDGKLVAVLKYRKNSCFSEDLAGYPPLVAADACHLGDEEIVTSEPISTGVNDKTSPPATFEFMFPTGMPISATNVVLQIVYRGTLGAESDAVVVATKDISEPSFFSFLNATDYITLAGKVYTREQIDAEEALVLQAKPDCINSDVTPRKLKVGCFEPLDLNIVLEIGANPTKVTKIEAKSLKKLEFFRIATLSDVGTDVVFEQQTEACDSVQVLPMKPYVWQFFYNPDRDAVDYKSDNFKKIRGLNGWLHSSCVQVGDLSPPGMKDNREEAMLPLDTGTQPTAIQINGENGF